MPSENSTISILLTSTSYPLDETDWRGIFIKDMVCSLANNKEISIKVWAPPGIIHNNAEYVATKNESTWLHNLMVQGGIAHLLRKKRITALTSTLKLLFQLKKVYQRHQKADLLHINWLQNILPLGNSKQPILVTVLGSDMGLLKFPGMTRMLRHTFKKHHTIIAPNAEWMVDILRSKFGDITEIRSIPFGIHSQWYQLKRQAFNTKTKKWLVVIRLTKKKVGSLFEWGEKIFQGQNELHLFGPNQESLRIPSWVYYHGSTNPAELQDKWFPEAAGLITLSQHDEGRPQVMLEAMAAGLPILASSIAAHKNFIDHKNTGVIIETQKEFEDGIQWLSDINNNQKISKQAKTWVTNHLGTWDDCANRYINAYNDLMRKK